MKYKLGDVIYTFASSTSPERPVEYADQEHTASPIIPAAFLEYNNYYNDYNCIILISINYDYNSWVNSTIRPKIKGIFAKQFSYWWTHDSNLCLGEGKI